MEDRIITYGGQAVIEGVLMRGQSGCAIAMRAPDGEIKVHTEKLSGIYKSKVAKIPFLRGSILLWDALGLGMRALTIAANTQSGEDEKLEGPMLYGVMTLSLLISIGIFFLLPFGLSKVSEMLGLDVWSAAVVEGVIRLIFIIGYMWAIGKMPEINRLFRYHGAEHKTINAFEAGAELTPENVAKFPLEHPRCGTSFLLTLVIFSIVAFSFLHVLPLGMQFVARILLIPVLAGVALEYIRWVANHLDSPIVQWLIKPNLALQHLTTREPDLSMLEVSIRSFNEMRALEKELTL